MSDATPSAPSSRRSSVLYALGRLEESNKNLKEELQGLPQRLAEMWNPRLVALETASAAYDRRITFLERRAWMLAGGAAVVVFVATEVVPHLFQK